MVKDLKTTIVDWIDSYFQQEAFQDCFLLDVDIHDRKQKLQVWLDADQGLSLNRCAKINRGINQLLEETEWAAYGVEVSSPGLENPLKLKRQWIKNVGRKVKVKLAEQPIIEGALLQVDEDSITVKSVIPSKKQKKEYKQHIIEQADILEIYVLPAFK